MGRGLRAATLGRPRVGLNVDREHFTPEDRGNSGDVEWSDDGTNWNTVHIDYPGGINGFAFGYTR